MRAGAMDARVRSLAVVLGALALCLLTALGSLRGSLTRISGDEGTYLAMAESLVRDLDLVFGEADESRIASASDPGRKTVILQRTGRGISYSKPLLPALVMAPFQALFGINGPVVANLLLLGVGLSLLWLHLRRLGTAGGASLTVATFGATGVLLPYTLWRTGDTLQTILALAGLLLSLVGIREESARSTGRRDPLDSRWAPVAGAVLLGLLVGLRPPNVLIAGIAPVTLALHRRWRRLGEFAVVFVMTVVVAGGVSWMLSGSAMPYKAERATFNPASGYPAGADEDRVATQFEQGRATSSLDATPDLRPRVSGYASLYFLIGRHTGILVYFPAALMVIFSALRRPDRTALVVLGAVVATAGFFILWLPFNYFGGGSCIGNRYFLVSYAALPLALRRPLGRAEVAASWILALVVGSSALASEWQMRKVEQSSQSHAYAGVFRTLPYESTASDLEGSRDRYFGKDFVRAVDPFVEARPWSFVLRSGDPPAELVLANLERNEPLRLLILSKERNLELVYEDYGKTESFRLSRPMGRRGLVEIEPSRPMRFHPLWFRNPWDHGKPYWVRVFRLGVRDVERRVASAEIRMLGREEFPPRIFERTVVEAELPATAIADSVSSIDVRARNDSRLAWRSDRLFPVFVSYRMKSLEGDGGARLEGARTPVPRPVTPKEELSVRLEIQWPVKEGAYHLEVDLVAEGVAWFEDVAGAPLVEGVVQVMAPDSERASAPRAGIGGE